MSEVFLAFVTTDYVGSESSLRELTAAWREGKPLVVVREVDPNHGGISASAFREAVALLLARNGARRPEGTTAAVQWLLEAAEGPLALEWHREKQFKYAVMRRIAELVYHHNSKAEFVSYKGRTSVISCMRAAGKQIARLTVRDRSSTAAAGSVEDVGGAEAAAVSTDRMIRQMRVKEELKLQPQAAASIVIYLSPYYKLLGSSGSGAVGAVGGRVCRLGGRPVVTMFDELRDTLTAVGVQVTHDASQSCGEDGRAVMLVVLCPGFFACPELVEEIAQALDAAHGPLDSPIEAPPPHAVGGPMGLVVQDTVQVLQGASAHCHPVCSVPAGVPRLSTRAACSRGLPPPPPLSPPSLYDDPQLSAAVQAASELVSAAEAKAGEAKVAGEGGAEAGGGRMDQLARARQQLAAQRARREAAEAASAVAAAGLPPPPPLTPPTVSPPLSPPFLYDAPAAAEDFGGSRRLSASELINAAEAAAGEAKVADTRAAGGGKMARLARAREQLAAQRARHEAASAGLGGDSVSQDLAGSSPAPEGLGPSSDARAARDAWARGSLRASSEASRSPPMLAQPRLQP